MPIAKALKAKILMLSASPIFNGNSDFSSLIDNQGNSLVNQSYDPQKWVLAKDALLDAIESAEANGHSLYQFNQQIPINGGINEQITQELSLRAAITEPFNPEIIWAFSADWTGELQQWCQPRRNPRDYPCRRHLLRRATGTRVFPRGTQGAERAGAAAHR